MSIIEIPIVVEGKIDICAALWALYRSTTWKSTASQCGGVDRLRSLPDSDRRIDSVMRQTRGSIFPSTLFILSVQFYGMKNNQVYGQGGDVGWRFCYRRFLRNSIPKGKLEFQKSYIGKHIVKYAGEITVSDEKCSIDGYWTIGKSVTDKFNMELTLSRKSIHCSYWETSTSTSTSITTGCYKSYALLCRVPFTTRP